MAHRSRSTVPPLQPDRSLPAVPSAQSWLTFRRRGYARIPCAVRRGGLGGRCRRQRTARSGRRRFRGRALRARARPRLLPRRLAAPPRLLEPPPPLVPLGLEIAIGI